MVTNNYMVWYTTPSIIEFIWAILLSVIYVSRFGDMLKDNYQ